VGWAGLEEYLRRHPEDEKFTAISLETAHPAKFPDEVRAITGVEPPVPKSLLGLEEKKEHYDEIDVDYGAFKRYLQKEYRA
jgi:threonine synthase